MTDPEVAAYEARRAQAESEPHRLDAFVLTKATKAIFATRTRRELDNLTRRLWRRYGTAPSAAVNRVALEQLKRGILARREMLRRNEPR